MLLFFIPKNEGHFGISCLVKSEGIPLWVLICVLLIVGCVHD